MAALPQESGGTIAKRLLWVMVLRVVMTSVLLGATIIFAYTRGESLLGASPKFLLSVIGVTYFLTIIYAVWYRIGKAVQRLAAVQLAVDLLLWTCIAYATGGIVSGFTFLFDLWIIVAAVLLGGRAAFVLAAGAAVLLAGLAAIMYFGVVSALPDQATTSLSAKEYLYFLAVNVVALFVVATLVGSLVARLERTGEGLEYERKRRADLAQLHEDMIRSLAVGIATTSESGDILMMNPAGQNILEITDQDILGKALSRWLPDPVLRPHSGDVEVLRGDGHAKTSAGKEIPIEYVVAPLTGAGGTRRGSIVAFSDQSEVRRLEAEVERSRRLAALGELAASLAHEIRNPLGAVSGSFQMLADATSLSPEDTKLVDIISRELTRIERLVTDMLHYSRPSKAERVPMNVGRLVEETVKAFMLGRDPVGIDVSVNIDVAADLEANVDQAQIRQVLWNLLRNAAQFTESGDHIDARAFNEPDGVVVEIRDTGPGIDDNDIGKIFDPFFSTRERGIGLGLALCKGIIEQHAGEITARNRKSGGCTFRIVLQASDKS